MHTPFLQLLFVQSIDTAHDPPTLLTICIEYDGFILKINNIIFIKSSIH